MSLGQPGQGQGSPRPSVETHVWPWSRQDKEAWIKDKYVEKKFVRKLPSAPAREAPRRWRGPKCQRYHSSPRAPTPRRQVRMEPVLPSVAALCSGGVPAGVSAAQLTDLGGLGGGSSMGGAPGPWTPGRWRGAGGQREGGGAPGHPLLCPLPAWPGSHPAAGSVEPRFRRDSLFCPDELDSLFSYFDAGAAAAGPRSKLPAAHPLPSLGRRAGDRHGLPGGGRALDGCGHSGGKDGHSLQEGLFWGWGAFGVKWG